jgi:hypothetical protein
MMCDVAAFFLQVGLGLTSVWFWKPEQTQV